MRTPRPVPAEARTKAMRMQPKQEHITAVVRAVSHQHQTEGKTAPKVMYINIVNTKVDSYEYATYHKIIIVGMS